MASAALIVKDDGSFEATPELMQKLRLVPGTRLEFVEQDGTELRFRASCEMREISGWRDLEGILAESPVDLNDERKKERERELASENRWHE